MNDTAGPAEDVRALRALILSGEQFRQAVAERFGAGLTESMAMSHLRAEGQLTARQLAERTGLTPSTVTALVGRLEEAGLAQRRPHPSDRRKVVVSPTAEGDAQLERSEQWLATVLADIDDIDRAELTRVASRLSAGLDTEAEVIRNLARE